MRYHPLGYRQPVSPHLRYFLRDRQGRKLGCLLFNFAARNVECRDAWIGWQGQAHRKHLDLAVGNSRFLVFPSVRCGNLASKALGLCLRRPPHDFQRRYGYRPLLVETFCEIPRFRGTCYRAANWIHVGQTQGRGKLDTHYEYALPVKDIFLKPLCPDWKDILNR